MAIEGDKVAFGQLVETYQRPVYYTALRILQNGNEAEEAAQEAFIRAYNNIQKYDINRKFSSWLLTITSNYCIDIIRQRRAVLLSIDEPLHQHEALMSDKAECPEHVAINNEKCQSVQSLLGTLPTEYRQALELCYWEEMNYEEIATVQDTTVSAVKSRLYRAKRILAKELKNGNHEFSAVFTQSAEILQPLCT